MKQMFKKYWMVICFALIINIPIICFGIIRTDNEIILKGDTTEITSFVDVDTDYEELGSFSSIYVIDVEKSTYLQNFISKLDKTSSVSKMSKSYLHISDYESYQIGQIQKKSSLMVATINAYENAKKKDSSVALNYSFRSFCVSFYFEGSPFQIGDEIVSINNISYTDGRQALVNALLASKSGDVVTVNRKDSKKEITLSSNIYDLCRFYTYYDIKYSEASPKISFGRSSAGGPSGGLLQTLSIFNRLTSFDYTRGKKISGTGTIGVNGSVGSIGGIKQKVFTAFEDGVDVFFCPKDNYEDALKAYNLISGKEKMALVMVEKLDDAIRYLENV